MNGKHRSLMVFIAGALVGSVVGGGVGLGGGALILLQHPHFASRLREALTARAAPEPTFAPGSLANVVVKVDATASGRPISKYIYGVASADTATLLALGATVNRWGGDPSSRYNWANGHAWNASRDW